MVLPITTRPQAPVDPSYERCIRQSTNDGTDEREP